MRRVVNVHEEANQNKISEADEMNLGVYSKDQVMHI